MKPKIASLIKYDWKILKNRFIRKIKERFFFQGVQRSHKSYFWSATSTTQYNKNENFCTIPWSRNIFRKCPEKEPRKEFLSRKSHFRQPLQKVNPEQVQHFLKKLSSNSNIRVLEFTPYLNSISTLNPDTNGLPIHKLGSKIIIAMRGSKFLWANHKPEIKTFSLEWIRDWKHRYRYY